MKFVGMILLTIGFAGLGWMIEGSDPRLLGFDTGRLLGILFGSFIAWGLFIMKEEVLDCIKKQRS